MFTKNGEKKVADIVKRAYENKWSEYKLIKALHILSNNPAHREATDTMVTDKALIALRHFKKNKRYSASFTPHLPHARPPGRLIRRSATSSSSSSASTSSSSKSSRISRRRVKKKPSTKVKRANGRPSARWLYDNNYAIGTKVRWVGWTKGVVKYLRLDKNGRPFLSLKKK